MIGKTDKYISEVQKVTALPGLRRRGRMGFLDDHTQKRGIRPRGKTCSD
jgi:hypothetical protein